MKGRFVLSLLLIFFATSVMAQTLPHNLLGNKHRDTDFSTAPTDGQVLKYTSSTGKWGPGSGTDSRIGTLTNTKWCYSDGDQILCTEDAPAGTGDITAVGSCASGSCAQIGNADTSAGYIDFLEDSDNGTNYVRLIGAASTADVTVTLPATTGTLMLTTGSPAAMVIASQAQGDLLYASSGTAWARLGAGTAGNPLISGGAAANPSWLGVVMAGGTNTFSITNGTASLDVAAGATLNIDTSLAVNTAAVTLVGKSGGSSLTLPTAISFDGTHADGRICTYASTGTVVSCNTATSTFQTADADLTTFAGLTATRGDILYVGEAGTWADLAKGDANTVLYSDGTDVKYGSVTSAMITDNTITASDLAATLTFADGDFVDLSGVTMSGTNDEGMTLPFWADVTPTSGATKRFITWDESGSVLKIYTAGGWTTINPSAGAPTDVAYLVTGSLSGSLSAERLLAEGLAIDFTDAGANGNFTIAFDPTELTGNRTFAAGGAAAVTWTWDNSGTTDPALTFGDGLISSNSTLLPATNDGAALGNTSYMWSDLFLASGSVVNFNNGDVTLTHSENTLTIGGGTLALGANSLTMTGSIAATGNRVTKGWFTDIESTNAPSVNGTAANATGGLITNPMTTAGDLITGAASGAATGRIAAVAAGQPLLSGGVGTASAYAGYTFSGTASQTYTFPGATDTLAGLATAQTFTANNVFGNADTDTLTLRSLIVGGNSRAVWIAGSAPSPTYATGTNELYVGGDVESGGNVYAANFVSTGTGESYIGMANNASRSPTASAYEIYFEGASDLKFNVNGAEKTAARLEDAQTFTGAKTFSDALTLNRGATGAGQLIIAEDSDDGTNTVTITAQAMAASYTLTLPTTDGDSGQFLQTNGSGSLTWAAPTAAAAGSDTQVQFNDGGSALGGDAGFVFAKTTGTLTIGKNTVGGEIILYNELGATDYNATIQPNAAQAAAATITLPAATGTLIAEGLATGGIVLGDSTPDADGEIGYASNAYKLFANSEDLVLTASANLWTFSSATSATVAFTPSVALNGGASVGGTLALGANSITMSGSIGVTGTRITKGWFTDVESTNMPTVGGTAILSSLTAPQFTTIELGAASDTTLSRVSAGVIAVEGTTIATVGANTFTGLQTIDATAGIKIGSTGVLITSDNDGAITLLGASGGYDEDLTINLDDTENAAVFSSSTGVTKLDFSALNLVTTGTIQGGIAISSDADGMDASAMTAAGMYGTMFIATGAGTWTLPRAALGMSVCLMDSGTAHDLILDVTAGSTIRLKGTEGADGVGITNASGSTTGDFVCVVAVATDKWSTVGMSGTWASQ